MDVPITAGFGLTVSVQKIVESYCKSLGRILLLICGIISSTINSLTSISIGSLWLDRRFCRLTLTLPELFGLLSSIYSMTTPEKDQYELYFAIMHPWIVQLTASVNLLQRTVGKDKVLGADANIGRIHRRQGGGEAVH